MNINWQVDLPSHTALQGNGQVQGDLQSIQLKLSLSGPFQASLSVDITDPLKQLNWQSKINISHIIPLNST